MSYFGNGSNGGLITPDRLATPFALPAGTTAVTPAANDRSTLLPTTAWVQTTLADNALLRFTTGQDLPSVNKGAIWHDDYASFMTWQALSNNGITYTGYASVNVGQVAYFDSVSVIPGFIKLNGATLSASYAALKAAIGRSTLIDARGEFFRGLDDGRGIDTGRVIGSSQISTQVIADNDGLQTTGAIDYTSNNLTNLGYEAANSSASVSMHYVTSTSGSIENSSFLRSIRPRNIALTAYIKF